MKDIRSYCLRLDRLRTKRSGHFFWAHLGIVALLALCLSACAPLDRQVFEALDESWKLLKPYTEAGIEADAAIDEASRVTRLRQVEEFTRLLETALKESE